jgi:CubicO group peptidase (beta-lactamase class C family)
MLAHDGEWRNRRIVPRDWIVAATTIAKGDEHLRPEVATPTYGYGYQVWLLPGPGRTFAMRGLRGQALFVDPDTRTVMVHTAVEPYQHGADARALWRGVLRWLR